MNNKESTSIIHISSAEKLSNYLNGPLVYKEIPNNDVINEYDETIRDESSISNLEITSSINKDDDFTKFGFWIEKGRYHVYERTGKTLSPLFISNFVMKSVYHLIDGSQNTLRIILIQKYTGQKHIREIKSSDLKIETFETILKSVGCTFFGNSYQLKKIFSFLMDNETEAIALNNIGFYPEHEIYVFADSLINTAGELKHINEFGIIQENKKLFYLPAYSLTNLENNDYYTERLYKYQAGNIDFAEWSKLIYEAYGINGGIGILFSVLAIFRDIVFNEVKFFPYLFLFGDFGTGKTSFVEKLLHLFGNDTVGIPLNNTTSTALSRIVNQRSNSIFYLKEYTSATDEKTEDFILTAYDGSGRNIGQKTTDNKTKSFLVKSAIIFDGNALPAKNTAIFSRIILLSFEKQKFTENEDKAFKKLKLEALNGFSQITKEIFAFRQVFKSNFKLQYEFLKSELKDIDKAQNLPERTQNHIALILATYRVLVDKVKFPFPFEELAQKVVDYSIEQNQMLIEIQHTTIFWNALESQKALSKDYYLIEYDDPIERKFAFVYVQVKKLFPIYCRYCKDNNYKPSDLNSLIKLLTNSSNKSFIPGTQGSRSGTTTVKKGFGSCYKFRFECTSDEELKINESFIKL